MSELLDLQEQFQQYIITGDEHFKESVIATKTVSVETRLGVYRDGYSLRLIECLNSNFPALVQYLGSDAFTALAHAYIDKHQSSYRSIRWYGDRLPDFLSGYFAKERGYLAELADFEWKMTLAFDAADEQRVCVEDMTTIPPEQWAGLQFKAHQSLQLMNYFWNTVPLWKALVHDTALPLREQSSQVQAWVLWRSDNYMIQYYSLSEDEAWALAALVQGLSFGELCEGLCHWNEPQTVAMRAASFLKNWIEKGMLAGLIGR